ncbi:MAG: 8-amino-7-oxononanoate synthase [Thermodesulfovibrionales bacterium]|nr:8-amino-7-oxononanoate synthase [Nitrospinota bacterium]MCG2709275.1 8-amino-7-oxononanoate synthase [Thermodesulfovibrionales bacterium]MCG2813357.1 8-amino-7-oxononanoate synthase [Thermodesulfovibrionales bacterium]MDP3048288.1 8-amino-7-oxononanoate synthase [Thermodesulfovibrionales bacterium]
MFSESLIRLKETNLLREIKNRNSPQGTRIVIDGKEYINFSSNDYLGLANHPRLIESSKKAIETFGFGSGASRLLCGGSILHSELEKRTAKFKGTESALIFNSGYSANTGIIPAITDEGDVIFSDELNHASIVDGCRLSRAKKIIYRHKDMGHLKELIEKESALYRSDGHSELVSESHAHKTAKRASSDKMLNQVQHDSIAVRKYIVVTDSVFSMDGDIAPLKEIYNLCLTLNSELSTPNLFLYIDDAHGTGVLGNGKGALAHFGIKSEPWIIQMGTFSKALGSFGAFAAGSKDIIEWILNTARSFIFSTALPSCAAAASTAALEVIEREPELLNKLWSNREQAVHGIIQLGYDIMGSETPIIPVRTGTVEKALQISQHLLENGIFAPAIRPPSVKEPRIRITVTAAHTAEDIERLIKALSL